MPYQLQITCEELAINEAQPLTMALLAGRLIATVVSRRTGEHVTVQLKCRRKQAGKWTPCTFAEASRVFADVPGTSSWEQDGQGNDKIGTYYPTSEAKYGGLFWPDSAADPARVWACLFVLRAAAGRAISDQAELLQGVNCLYCGRELTDPESISRNLGPDCYGKVTGSRHQRKGTPGAPSAAQAAVEAPDWGITPDEVPEGSDRLTMAQEGLLFRPAGASYRDVVSAR